MGMANPLKSLKRIRKETEPGLNEKLDGPLFNTSCICTREGENGKSRKQKGKSK